MFKLAVHTDLLGPDFNHALDVASELGIEHIKSRKAFGRPLGSFEGIQFPLAEHHCNIDAVKLQTYRAAWMMDKMYKKKGFTHHDVSIAAAISKLRAPIYGFELMNEVADWLGALGYTKEFPIEMGIRAIRSYSIGAEGTLNIMRIIIARELLGKEFLPYR